MSSAGGGEGPKWARTQFETRTDTGESTPGGRIAALGRRLSASFNSGGEQDNPHSHLSGLPSRQAMSRGDPMELRSIEEPMAIVPDRRRTIRADSEDALGKYMTGTNMGMRSAARFARKPSQQALFTNQSILARQALRRAVESGADPLHQAARDGIVLELHDALERDQQLQVIDSLDGNSYGPLHYAARGNHIECVQLLLDSGADVNVQGDEERTPLFLAAKCNRPAVVKVLVCHPGIKTDVPDMYGMLPSHVAARRGHLQVLQELDKTGALHVNATDFHGNNSLHHCCLSGNDGTAKFLLEHGALPLSKNSNKETAYHLAAKEGFASVLKVYLKQKMFDLESQRRLMMADRDNEGNTCLHLAAQNGHIEVVSLCIKELADINGQNNFFGTPLHLAAVNGHEDVVRKLVSEGAQLNVQDLDRMTPLHRATKFNRLAIVNYLLSEEDRIKVDAPDASGNTPMLLAASQGHVEIMTALHRYKASIGARDACDRTSLHLAVMNREIKAVDTSLKLGGKAILNAVDRDESTALHLAAKKGFFKICQLLGEKRCDMTARDEHERIPLHWAASEGKFRTTKFLIESTPTNVNDIDDQGRTPLHLAAINGHQRLCELLMDLGADVWARDNRRWTPLCHASFEGHCNTMESLLEHGSPVNILDHKGNTPLHLACEAGHCKSVRTLLEYKALLPTRNSAGLTCFDVAIEMGHEDVAEVIIHNPRWHEVMMRQLDEVPPMVRLIEKMPSIAETVLDQCLWVTPGKKDVDDCVTYDFQYIYDPPLNKQERPDNYVESNPVDLMVTEKTESLLSHHLTQALMKYKWRTFGKWVFLSNLVVYVVFISFLTLYVANNKTKNEQDEYTVKDTAFATQRAAKYRGFTTAECVTDDRTATFHYLTGRNSIVNQTHPCTSIAHDTACESHGTEDISLFSADANYTCPQLVSANTSNYILGCVGPAYYATGSHVTIFEWRDRALGVCNNFRFNATCWLDNGDWGVIYSRNKDVVNTSCNSPYTVPPPQATAVVSQTILAVFALLQIFKELVIVALKGRSYLNDVGDSFLEWSLYILTLCFVWPGRLGLQPTDWQWQCGALAVFLAWFDLVLFIQRFSFLGIYVVMFKSVLKTLMEVSIVFLMFGVAFGLSFYILFQGQENFRSIPWSLLQTMVMTLGEVEYFNIFVSNIADVPYVGVSVFTYLLFICIMPILLMNLLVGLAVGDIEAVKQSAFLRRLEMQVEMISSVERWLPFRLQKYFHMVCMKRYPRRPLSLFTRLKEFTDTMTSMGGAEESFGNSRDTEKEQRLVQISSELGRQKTRMRGVQKQLDMQSRMLRTIAEQMKIKSEVYESDNDDDDLLDELYS